MKTDENSRMAALAGIIADLKAENIELTQCVDLLTEKHNEVLRQLNDKEKHEPSVEGRTPSELTEALDKCEVLEKDNKLLKQQCVHLQMERNEAKTRADDCENQNKELFRQIQRFEQSEFMKIGAACTCKPFAPGDEPVKVGSAKCVNCRHFLKMDKDFCVLCACRYDGTAKTE